MYFNLSKRKCLLLPSQQNKSKTTNNYCSHEVAMAISSQQPDALLLKENYFLALATVLIKFIIIIAKELPQQQYISTLAKGNFYCYHSNINLRSQIPFLSNSVYFYEIICSHGVAIATRCFTFKRKSIPCLTNSKLLNS